MTPKLQAKRSTGKAKLVWTQNLKKPEDKEQFEKLLRSAYASDKIYKRLIEILKDREAQTYKEMIQKIDLSDSTWPNRQAQMTGRLSELSYLISLFDLEERDDNNA